VSEEQMQTIERQVNEKIRQAVPVHVKVYEEGDTTLKQVNNNTLHASTFLNCSWKKYLCFLKR